LTSHESKVSGRRPHDKHTNRTHLLISNMMGEYSHLLPHFRIDFFYAIAGEEFGDNEGKVAMIMRALYGLKSSGSA